MDNLVDIVFKKEDGTSEATVLEWLKAPGDSVEQHEPILEVSTDKVTVEIAAPASGTLSEIIAGSNTTVGPGTVLGRIQIGETHMEAETRPSDQPDEDLNIDALETNESGPRLSPLVRRMLREHGLQADDVRGSGRDGRITHRDILAHLEGQDTILENDQGEDLWSTDDDADAEYAPPTQQAVEEGHLPTVELVQHEEQEAEVHAFGPDESIADPAPEFDEPLIDVDLEEQVVDDSDDQKADAEQFHAETLELAEPEPETTGFGTDNDIQFREEAAEQEPNLYGFLSDDAESVSNASFGEPATNYESDLESAALSDCGPPTGDASADAPQIESPAGIDPQDSSASPHFVFESEVTGVQPHSPMRRAIAQHMVESVRRAPHVTAVFDADMTAVISHRALHRIEAERRGIRLTYTSYFVAAAVEAMKAVPEVNSVFHDDGLELLADVNIGIATALGSDGLVVPVLHNADQLDLLDIARRLQDLISTARNGSLSRSDVAGGTFTITNHGVSGSLIATPIINQPQSAILGVGRLEKRVVVREVAGRDVMQILPMVYLTLTIDHRALDGYQANRFLSRFVEVLETWQL